MSEISPDSILDYRNAAGRGWRLVEIDGIRHVYREKKTLQEYKAEFGWVRDFRLRDDDVLIAAHPKCGTHWLWEIVTMIQNGSTAYSPHVKGVTMLGREKYEKTDTIPSPRVLNTHLRFKHLPQKLLEKKIKVVHMMRNPKDVSVSFYNHMKGFKPPFGFDGSYSEFADLFMNGKVRMTSYFDYIKDWQKVQTNHPELPILNLFYEDLKRNPVETIQQVSQFLCKATSRELCQEIADACGFDKLKRAHKRKREIASLKNQFQDDFPGFYRKGQIGDWKNWLTVAQNEAFDEVIERELKDTGIEFTY